MPFLLFQLDALKRTVDRTAMDLESTRSTVTQLKKDVVDKTNRSRSLILQGWDSSASTRISVEQKYKSIVDDDHFRKKMKKKRKKSNIPKQSESVFGLSAFCCVLIVIPGCACTLHCCSGFQKWRPRKQTSSLAEKVSMKQECRMVGGGNERTERWTMKTSVSLFENHVWVSGCGLCVVCHRIYTGWAKSRLTGTLISSSEL